MVRNTWEHGLETAVVSYSRLIFDKNMCNSILIYIYISCNRYIEKICFFSIAGPMTIRDPKTGVHTVIGVASLGVYPTDVFGDETKVDRATVIYARVNKVLPWIYEQMS